MRAIVTVIGKDKVGIIAKVCSLLAEKNVNILDISQTILAEHFTMIMVVDCKAATVEFNKLSDELEKCGSDMGLSVRIQREDMFEAMHRI